MKKKKKKKKKKKTQRSPSYPIFVGESEITQSCTMFSHFSDKDGIPDQDSCTAWCSETGSLTSLDACNSGASSDRREPISLHQAVSDEKKKKKTQRSPIYPIFVGESEIRNNSDKSELST